MDAATFQTTLVVIAVVFAGFFLLVLRYGFGARRVTKSPDDDDPEARDPVCGIDIQKAAAAATLRHSGRTYYFCSTSCRERFEKDPAEYSQEAPRQRGCC